MTAHAPYSFASCSLPWHQGLTRWGVRARPQGVVHLQGFAVIDLETTGFAYNHTDRVCEIGVVLVGPDGRREDCWTTLVNPQRDLGAQHVHRIDAADARTLCL